MGLTRTALARRLATGAGIVAVEQRVHRIESMTLVVGEPLGLALPTKRDMSARFTLRRLLEG